MDSTDDLAQVERLHAASQRVKDELANVIVGQSDVIEQLLVALFAGGHCLLVGVPGLAKTLLVRTLADTLDLEFSRIQFTPDLMPTDITGTEVMHEDRATGERTFRFRPGPIFANVILADEVNRTPPKTQAALLEAMQEHQVTAAGERHALPQPFFVLATQNPIEQEGTYPLPEAQLDRFMLHVNIGYPNEHEELDIVRRTTGDTSQAVSKALSGDEIRELTRIVRRVPVADHIALFALRIARLSRPNEDDVPEFVKNYVMWGAGPRASQYLVLGAKAFAVLHGRYFVSEEDIRAVASPVLRHRIKTNFNADADGVNSDVIVKQLLDTVEMTDQAESGDLAKVFKSSDTRQD